MTSQSKQPTLSYDRGFVPQLSTGQQEILKWLAILTMTLDHLNKFVFHYDYPVLLWVGRLAFPLFAFLIAYNLVVREVKPSRYLYPLFLFALVTQPFFMWATHDILGNILFTLYAGVLYLGLHTLLVKRLGSAFAHLFLIALFFIPSLQVEYGPIGVFFIPALVAFLRQPSPLTYMFMCVYLVAVNAVSTSSVIAFFTSPFHGLYTLATTLEPYVFIALLLFPIVVAVSHFPISLKRTNPWFFYIFYPAHIFVFHLLASYTA